MDKNIKQPIWEASNGPLFLKSVWIEDKGYRHFILDHDRTVRKRRSFSDNKKDPLTAENTQTAEDWENLQLIGSSEITQPREAKHQETSKKLCKIYPKQKISFERLKRQLHENISNKNKQIKQQKSEDTSNIGTENPDQSTSKILDSTKNQLTERVLNWLDLAGKNTLIRTENETSDNPALPKRRIFTADTLKTQLRPNLLPLRRSESVHHLSLTLNENEMDFYNNKKFFEASSRCNSAIKFGDFFPNAYRCSRKFLAHSALKNNKQKTDFVASMKKETNSEKDKNKRKNLDRDLNLNLENQYKNIIHKQILENSCNTQLAKRQLHIFMPNLPNKKLYSNTDCESCLSTIVSEMSKL